MTGVELLIAAVPMLMMVGGIVGVVLNLERRERLRRIEAWRAAAHSAGLRNVQQEASLWSVEEVSGWAGTRRVRFSAYQRGGRTMEDEITAGTRLVIEGDSGLTLRREDNVDELERAVGKGEIEIGDEAFDRWVYVQGPLELVRAVLDVETRRRLLELIGGRVRYGSGPGESSLSAYVSLRNGDLQAEFPGADVVMRAQLAGILETLLAILERLTPPASISRRLAENTAVEPEWPVRLANVVLLTRLFPYAAATREVLRRALEDERQEVQLHAALTVGGDAGRRVLLEIATREWADDTSASRAVGALGAAIPPERVREVLAHALRTRRVATARACVDALGRGHDPETISLLAKVLAFETPPLAVAAAAALGSSGAATAESPLLEALKRGRPEVRVAAAVALGHVGSAAAVLPLKEAAQADGALRRAAREAVAQIQSRLSGASPGQLSLTEGDAGRLSLADADPKGQVSLAERAPGEASGPAGAGPGPAPGRSGSGSRAPSR